MSSFYSTFAMLILTFGIGVLAYLSVDDVILHLAIIQPVVFSAIWDSHLQHSQHTAVCNPGAQSGHGVCCGSQLCLPPPSSI
eukprot:11627941-Ditylum_brightwellii.AAC.1